MQKIVGNNRESVINVDNLSNEMKLEHRTVQQLIAPAIFAVLKQWSDDYTTGNFDARNEATCRLAYVLVNGLETVGGPAEIELFETLNFPYI